MRHVNSILCHSFDRYVNDVRREGPKAFQPYESIEPHQAVLRQESVIQKSSNTDATTDVIADVEHTELRSYRNSERQRHSSDEIDHHSHLLTVSDTAPSVIRSTEIGHVVQEPGLPSPPDLHVRKPRRWETEEYNDREDILREARSYPIVLAHSGNALSDSRGLCPPNCPCPLPSTMSLPLLTSSPAGHPLLPPYPFYPPSTLYQPPMPLLYPHVYSLTESEYRRALDTVNASLFRPEMYSRPVYIDDEPKPADDDRSSSELSGKGVWRPY